MARAIIMVVSILLSSVVVGQEDVCQKAEEAPLFVCLNELGKYGSGMVVPNGTPGNLKFAIDDAYETLQGEWTGPRRDRTYMQRVYWMVPIALLAYYALIMGVRGFVLPSFPPDDNPRWRSEKVAIIAGAIVVIGALFAERVYTYTTMREAYDVLPQAIERFVHLRTPTTLFSITKKPCDLVFENFDPMLVRCPEGWTQGAKVKKSHLMMSRFTDASLLEDLIGVGKACHNIDVIPDWAKGRAPQELDEKLDCEVLTGGEGGEDDMRVEHLQGLLDDFGQWAAPQGGASKQLVLENAFVVRDSAGGFIYRERVHNMIGPDAYRGYTERFLQESALWVGIGSALILFSAYLIYRLRKQELEEGSEKHGEWLSAGLGIGVTGAFLASVGIPLTVWIL